MDELSGLIATGLIISIIITSLKTGIGCGLANLKKREVLYVAISYLILSIAIGSFIGLVPSDITEGILATGVTLHLVIAVLLIIFGIQTKKKWLATGCDNSKKSFLLISMPCPVCLCAIFLSCMILSDIIEMSGFFIGLIVGLIFFVVVLLSSFSISSIASLAKVKTPSTLGTAMILFGLFYLISPIVIPSYIEAQSLQPILVLFDLRETALSFLFMAILIIFGFFSDSIKSEGRIR